MFLHRIAVSSLFFLNNFIFLLVYIIISVIVNYIFRADSFVPSGKTFSGALTCLSRNILDVPSVSIAEVMSLKPDGPTLSSALALPKNDTWYFFFVQCYSLILVFILCIRPVASVILF